MLNVFRLFGSMYVFLVSIALIGTSFKALGGAFDKPAELSNLVEVGLGSQPGVTSQALVHQMGHFDWDRMFPKAGDVFEVDYISASGTMESLKKITIPNSAPALVEIQGRWLRQPRLEAPPPLGRNGIDLFVGTFVLRHQLLADTPLAFEPIQRLVDLPEIERTDVQGRGGGEGRLIRRLELVPVLRTA